jgi:glycosyltransferase involved in cell wall biosynthesis
MISDPMASYPEKSYHSSSIQLNHMVDGLLELGHDIDLVIGSGENIDNIEGLKIFDYPNRYVDLGDKLNDHRHQATNDFFHNRVIGVLRDNMGEYDIIHVHDTNLFNKLKLIDDLNTPILYTLHVSIDYDDSNETYMSAPYLQDTVDKTEGNYFTAMSNFVKDNSVKNADKIYVVYNGIDLDMFSFEENKEDFFIFVGRVSDKKGFSYILDALDHYDFNIKIAGPLMYNNDSDNDTLNVDGRLRNYNIEEYFNRSNVEYLGILDHDRVSEYLSKAKGLIHLHEWGEGFSMAIAESLSCGTPVLSTDRGGPGHYLLDGYDSIVLEGETFKDPIKVVSSLKDLENIKPENCRISAERFDKNKLGNQYEEVYRDILENM